MISQKAKIAKKRKKEMRSHKMDKRGVSPLIATVLLIAFAVALGAVVMNWGRSYVTEQVSEVKQTSLTIDCSGVAIDIPTIGEEQKICANSTDGTIKFMLDNNGDDITGIKITVIGDKGVDNPIQLASTAVERAKTISETVPYSRDDVGSKIEQIKIIPKITSGSQETFCTQNAATIDQVNECQ